MPPELLLANLLLTCQFLIVRIAAIFYRVFLWYLLQVTKGKQNFILRNTALVFFRCFITFVKNKVLSLLFG